jgi:hypothetical protein
LTRLVVRYLVFDPCFDLKHALGYIDLLGVIGEIGGYQLTWACRMPSNRYSLANGPILSSQLGILS